VTLHVIVTDTDEYPTWAPGVLPVWTTLERLNAFLDHTDVDAMPAELSDSAAAELLTELQSVGCSHILVDAVTMDMNVTATPIQDFTQRVTGNVPTQHY